MSAKQFYKKATPNDNTLPDIPSILKQDVSIMINIVDF